eukprot:3113162-Rhodomonas_salina.3
MCIRDRLVAGDEDFADDARRRAGRRRRDLHGAQLGRSVWMRMDKLSSVNLSALCRTTYLDEPALNLSRAFCSCCCQLCAQ